MSLGDEAAQDAAPDAALAPDAGAVKEALRARPELLTDDPDLLHAIASASADPAAGDVVDFQQFARDKLAEENRALRRAVEDLKDLASANHATQQKVLQAALALWSARGSDDVFETIRDRLPGVLGVEAVVLAVESEARDGAADGRLVLLQPGDAERLIGSPAGAVLRPCANASPALYGALAPHIASEALVRLSFARGAADGVLAFGSRDPQAFRSGQGVDLLTFLARAAERSLALWLDLPAA